tara:strand:+ start:61 stop:351 length:291 start_codon:yes stop_codon:yes gene_type:complete
MSLDEELRTELCENVFEMVKKIHSINTINSNILLKMYGLYKQTIVGDALFECDFKTLKQKRMWESWNGYKGMDKSDSVKKLVCLVNELLDEGELEY